MRAATGGSRAGSVSASPMLDMLSERAVPCRSCGRARRASSQHAEHAGRDVGEPPAALPPRAREGGDAGDGAVCDRRAGVPLRADAEADQRRLVLRQRARELAQILRRDAAALRLQLDGLLREPRDELVVAQRVRPAPPLVREPASSSARMTPSASAASSGERSQVPVGDARRAAAEGIDDDEPRAATARLEDEAPEMRGGGERVPAPHDDRARVHPLLGIDLGRGAVRRHRPRHAGARADRAHERRAAERVEQPARHDVALQDALRAEVAVGHDRCAAVALRRVAQAARGDVERLVPAHLPEARPRPWHRRARAGAARVPRSTRAPGSSRPCRTGSPP